MASVFSYLGWAWGSKETTAAAPPTRSTPWLYFSAKSWECRGKGTDPSQVMLQLSRFRFRLTCLQVDQGSLCPTLLALFGLPPPAHNVYSLVPSLIRHLPRKSPLLFLPHCTPSQHRINSRLFVPTFCKWLVSPTYPIMFTQQCTCACLPHISKSCVCLSSLGLPLFLLCVASFLFSEFTLPPAPMQQICTQGGRHSRRPAAVHHTTAKPVSSFFDRHTSM